MDRKNFYYRQIVTEAEIDAAFTEVENAFKELSVDHKLTGIITGLAPSSPLTSPFQVTLSAGVAYSKTLGRGMRYAGGVVDLSSIPLPSSNGEVKIVSIFAEPVYTESDPRTDGYGNPVNFVKTEAVQLNIEASALGSIGSPPVAPVLRSDQVLITDVVVYYQNATLSIFTVTYLPVTVVTTVPVGTLTVSPRTEYLLPPMAGDYVGHAVTNAGSLKDALTSLIRKNKQYQTKNTLSSLPATTINDVADVNAPASFDAFGSGGVFSGKPGLYHLKPVSGVSTYVPTVDVAPSANQEIEGSGPVPHVIDLTTPSVNLNLVTDGSYKLKNLTLHAPYSRYKVPATSVVPNYAKFENVKFNSTTANDKLFWNVQNATATKFRKSYNLELKNSSSGSGNLVFGSKRDSLGIPVTNIDGLESGNLTIDSNGGFYKNIRLVGSDTAVPVINITGDSNIIESIVLESPSGNAPMILISGKNNIIKTIYLHNFGTYSASISSTRPLFQALVFTPASKNNKVDSIYIQGGIDSFSGTDTDLASSWVNFGGNTVTDLQADPAGQPLGDRVVFGGGGYLERSDSLGETTSVFEIWAKTASGTATFRLKSAVGDATGDLPVNTEWKRYRVIATNVNTTTQIVNGTDNIANDIIFAHPARYALTNLGNLKLVDLSGEFNSISNITIENLIGATSNLIYFRAGSNSVINTVIDGIFNTTEPFILSNGGRNYLETVAFNNLRAIDLMSGKALITNEVSGNLILKNIDIDLSLTTPYLPAVTSYIDAGIVYLTGVSYLENVRLLDNPPSDTGKIPLYVSSVDNLVSCKNVYAETKYGSSVLSDINAGGAALAIVNSTVHFENSKFHALRGKAVYLDNVGGQLLSCTASAGNVDSNGVPLFLKKNSSTRICNIKDLTLIYSNSNLRVAATGNRPAINIDVDNTTIDGLRVISNLSSSSSGTGDNIGSTVPPTMTLDDSTAAFTVDDVGRYVTIAGATTPANNGTFIITARNSATSISYTNASGVVEAYTGNWSIKTINSTEQLVSLKKITQTPSVVNKLIIDHKGESSFTRTLDVVVPDNIGHLRMKDVSILNYKMFSNIGTLVSLPNTIIEDLAIDGYSDIELFNATKILDLSGSTVASNVRLFETYDLPATTNCQVNAPAIINDLQITVSDITTNYKVVTGNATPINMGVLRTGGGTKTVTNTLTEITPAVTGSINNYTTTDWSVSDTIKLNPNPNTVITGFVSSVPVVRKLLVNTSSTYTLTLANDSGSSDAENRVLSPTGRDYTLYPGNSVWLVRDAGSDRWRLVSDQNQVREIVSTGYISISGTQSVNYEPAGWSNADTVLFDPGPATIIRGLLGTAFSKKKLIVNFSATYTLTLNHLDVGVDPADQILSPTGTAYVLYPGNSVWLIRDNGWRIVSNQNAIRPVKQSAFLNPVGPLNNYSPTNWSTLDVLKLNPGAPLTINGFDSTVEINKKLITSISDQPITITHNDGGQGSGNKFESPTGVDYIISKYDSLWIVKDPISLSWKAAVDQSFDSNIDIQTYINTNIVKYIPLSYGHRRSNTYMNFDSNSYFITDPTPFANSIQADVFGTVYFGLDIPQGSRVLSIKVHAAHASTVTATAALDITITRKYINTLTPTSETIVGTLDPDPNDYLTETTLITDYYEVAWIPSAPFIVSNKYDYRISIRVPYGGTITAFELHAVTVSYYPVLVK